MKSFTKIATLGLMAAVAIATPIAASTAANAEVTQTAQFTVIQPAQDFGQFINVWTHVYTVNVDANGSFAGTGVVNGQDNSNTLVDAPETITGTFNADNTVSLEATRTNDGVKYSITNAIADGVTVNIDNAELLVPALPDYKLEMIVSTPVFTNIAPAPVKLGNHGDCVSSAAHAGVKGKDLASIAKVVTNVGAYGSATCPRIVS